MLKIKTVKGKAIMERNHKLSEKYNPKEFEDNLYKIWEDKKYFKPSMDKTKESYCIVMPPPNVTGRLHMGHALDGTMQDILIRYKRMCGYNTLWVPGTDHASIATEVKVAEKIKKEEGLSKEDLGREAFLERAWEWTHKYGGEIQEQQRKLGCSCDWERSRFTLDEGLSNAVLEKFTKLYKKGLIYKGKRMINWCPDCCSSISDIEVEYEEENSHLWHLRYKIAGTEDQYVVVATTRPETMLGDTAVAVHPEDERYKDLVGKKCILPIINKEIPIIADSFVEKEFGTGCVKVTPAHDMNDYQSGIRNNLEFVEIFDEKGIMNNFVPEYEGMKVTDARKAIVQKLEELGALVKTENYTHNVGKCYRCHNTIEPRISEQWFVKMKELAKPAIEAVKNDDIKFVPKRYEKTYFNWMENIQDWCISRQLWWGHRIPAYYCEDCGHITVAKSNPGKCEKCSSANIKQDEDTLDTWFSSALWPYSTLGWPEKTEDYETFYPTNTLVTGYDIIFFWVARMIFSALESTGEKPFSDILIHGIVRDSQGRKMSKSLGNGIDPLEVIGKYGTDALRFSLILGITPGNDIRFMLEKLEQASNFANKLWNAARFVLMNLEDFDENASISIEQLKEEDKWIISKLNSLVKEVRNNLDSYELGVATQKIYDFIWNEFCDWYIEIVKVRLYNKENQESRLVAQYTLNKVLGDSLKLLHPIMPFVTEQIYMQLFNNDESIMISEYPVYNEDECFESAEKNIETIKEIIVGIRNARASLNVPNSKKAELIVVTENYKELIKESEELLKKLGYSEEIKIQANKDGISENAVSVIVSGIEVYMPLENLVDLEKEKQRKQEEKKKIEAEIERATKMLSNPGFVNKAPASKIQEEKEKLEKYKEMLKKFEN